MKKKEAAAVLQNAAAAEMYLQFMLDDADGGEDA